MDKTTRSELIKTIESQKDKIQRYEARLRDLISAYKGLSKEKEALEASIQCLTATDLNNGIGKKSFSAANKENNNDKEKTDEEKEEIPHPLQSMSSESHQTDIEEKLATLTTTLSVLTNEKSRLESSYLAEKKQLKTENEDLQRRLEENEKVSNLRQQGQDEIIKDLKQKLRSQQRERELEQTDHAFMLRELQKLVSDERTAREDLEYQLDLSQNALQAKEKANKLSEQYEKRIHDLSNELVVLQNRLKAAEEKANQPSPLLLELQKELTSLKSQYHSQVYQEEQRANDAEDSLNNMAEQSEERVSGLEAKLSDLSEVVGNYERLRLQDQQAIQRLKERVAQLDTENMALAQAAHIPDMKKDLEEDTDVNDVQVLVDKIKKYKLLLNTALNQKSEKSFELDDIVYNDLAADCSLCKKYEKELGELKEEYERYKIRAQAILKSRSLKENTSQDDNLREQVSELREKVKTLHIQHEIQMKSQLEKEDNLHSIMVTLQEKHHSEQNVMVSEHRHQLAELEEELKKQRNRTISMLMEKDLEIARLQTLANLPTYNTDLYSQHSSSTSLPQKQMDALNAKDNAGSSNLPEEQQSFSKLLHNVSSPSGDMPLIHFAQEIARKDVDIASLRSRKYQLETALRELQHSLLLKEQKAKEEHEQLQEMLRKHERDKSREGANLEYLKNVVYQFLICTDSSGKQKMLNAIITILQFSPQEREKVYSFCKVRWG
ncbi:GRIP and coiled-coil domain-containing protein 1 isoform X1 [Octopus bimaculoides]|uniref:GRIP domain-containing protein n=1 Tax=Octopus bimaculoides TaxID=37653 RepID=A0A0L8GZU6_OCTBM|nr:GRIP and coiled-coil domain-containing protein 1 isoform X1 [Octopus bimaculoides]XP_052827749.1 GRIP and coiled-coil domain-containing protein 1 isoform X1 [Octopus bimaculoides]|eukprot:XP_014776944.1 PREDICTED: GRIP and coiled-coil domain-containing protein 1-like [Octopus bimaculoides]